MSTERVTRVSNRLPTPLVAVAVVVVLGLLVVGVRQVTAELRGGGDDRSAVAGAGNSGPPAGSATEDGDGSGAGDPDQDDQLRSEGGDRGPATVAVGPVVADQQFAFAPLPDRVAAAPGGQGARAAIPEVPDAGGPVDGPAGGAPSGPGGLEGQPGAELPDRPIDAAPDDLTMVASAETVAHYAELRVGWGLGLDGGLESLTIDFGDGTDQFEFDEDRIEAIGDRGQVSVTHTYEPTLTPQPQTATVTGVDDGDQIYERVLHFETRAAFRLGYSALTVTALEDCDTVGAGDFELTWQNDTSEPLGKTSTFPLFKNESYREPDFFTEVGPVHYDEVPSLFHVDGEPAFLYLKVQERDNFAGAVLEFVLAFPYEFAGSFGLPEFFYNGPVAQLGDHRYDVTLHSHAQGSSDCEVRLRFTATLTMH